MLIFSYVRKFLSRTVMAKCGHKTKMVDVIEIDGEKITFSLKKGVRPEYCINCLKEMSIKCAWCGKSILPGDPITLYSPRDESKVPEHAVIYKKDPLQLVGCLRWGCADTGADRAGFWVPPGEVQRVMSPLERAMATNNVVIVNDVTDINEAEAHKLN